MRDIFDHLPHPRPVVYADHDHVSMRFRQGELQSLMSVQQPNHLVVPYTRTMMGFLLMVQKPEHILMIGLGGGSLAKFCYHHLPETRITVVDINPHVIAMREHFQVPDDDARFRVVCADGADFVRDARKEFDVILVDGFDADGQSAQLSSKAFYEDACRVLRPRGVLAINLDSDHPAHSVFLERVHTTYRGNMVVIGVQERANHVVFATKGLPITSENLGLTAALENPGLQAHLQIQAELRRIFQLIDDGSRFPEIDVQELGRLP
jgi:spermidine synthase